MREIDGGETYKGKWGGRVRLLHRRAIQYGETKSREEENCDSHEKIHIVKERHN